MEGDVLEEEIFMTRSDIIHNKGFNMSDTSYSDKVPEEYRKIKVGVKNLEDATLNLGSIKNSLPTY
jgi:hypothetical protein